MNPYEMINIIDANWEEGALAPAQTMISEEVAKSGGTLEDIGSMGRRKLAYPINKHTEGLYLLSRFLHSPEGLLSLRDNLKLNPAVVRTLVVRYRGQPGIPLPRETPGGSAEPAAGGRPETRRKRSWEDNDDDEFQSGRDSED